MMGEWKEYRYTDLATIIGGGTPKTSVSDYWNGEIPWLSVKDFLPVTKYVYDTEKHISELGLLNSSTKLLEKNDIVISARGTIGAMAMIPYPMCFNQSCFGLRGNNVVDKNFLYYLTRTKVNELRKSAHGSVFDTITRETFDNLRCLVPPLQTQQKIGNILSSLDSKIELNKRINDNLEQQAQALFKSWFVDFDPFKDGKFVESELGRIPEGWRVERLGSVCKCLLGGTPSRNKEEYWNGKIAWINSGEINEFRITKPSEYITQEGLKKSATKLLPKKTTVLAITGATLGQVSLLEIDSCANQSVIGLLENEDIFHEYIYPLIKNRIDDLCSHMTGGAQQHINKNNVEQLEILVPPKKILVEYKQIATPIYSLISNICFESQKISKLRDSLLPRLMSGELKLDKINN